MLKVSAGTYILAAIACLCIPLNWLIAWSLSVLMHELSHIVTIKLLHIPIDQIAINMSGTIIFTRQLSPKEETICAAAGPLSGFLSLLFFRIFPEFSICGLLLALFNVLPVYPMDGGRVLNGILSMLKNRNISCVVKIVFEFIAFIVLFSASFYLLFSDYGPIPIIITLYLAYKNRKSKIPCKQTKQIVQ